MAPGKKAAIQEHGILCIIFEFSVLQSVSFHWLEDDGFSLFWRVIRRWWYVEVEIHWFLVGACDNSAALDADGHV